MNILEALKKPEHPLPCALVDVPQIGEVEVYPITSAERDDLNADFEKLFAKELSEKDLNKKWFGRVLFGPGKKFTKAQWQVFDSRATFETEQELFDVINKYPFDLVKKP